MQCPICDRPMILGKSVDKHHLIPKTFGGKEVTLMHRVCHQKIHSLFTERELQKTYHTVDAIRSHEEIKKFIKWLKNKPPEFYSTNREKR